MKAMVIEKFGGADILKMADLPAPKPLADEILIRVHFAGVNPVDYKIREGHLKEMLPHHFPLVLGWDVAGEVAEAGKSVTQFKKGDRVFAYARKPEVQWGTYAEFVTVKAENSALSPKSLKDEEAAAIPLVALTAWQAVHDFAKIKSGDKILIHAGAGGVGGFGIQFAKLQGATVLTTASQEKHSYVKTLGADYAIDYRNQNLKQCVKEIAPEGLDIVFDCVGGKTLEESFTLVRKGGTLVSIVDTPNAETAQRQGIQSGFVFVSPNGKELTEISHLFDAGKLKLPQIEVLPLAQAARAQQKLESRRVTGKLVLKID